MSALAWWLIPLAATIVAVAWAAWRSRPRRPADAHVAMQDMARFRQAMERPMPAGPSGRAGTFGAEGRSDARDPAA